MGSIERMLIPAKYRPSCRADLVKLLGNKAFLKDCGGTMNNLLESKGFWTALERRLDFVMYTILQIDFLGGARGESFLFRDFDSMSTDALFTMAEEEVKKKLPEPMTIVHDELFLQFNLVASGGMPLIRAEDYAFFVEPYFSGGVIFLESRMDSFGWKDWLKKFLGLPLTRLLKRFINFFKRAL